MVERLIDVEKATGSSPVLRTKIVLIIIKMLTKYQKAYFDIVKPEKASRVIHIMLFNEAMPTITDRVIKEIKNQIPEADVFCMGSSLLKISGENDIDIYISIDAKELERYKKELDKIYLTKSGPDKSQTHLHKWYWNESGSEVNVYLSDKNDLWFQEQLATFKMMQNSPDIIREYEKLKKSMDGKTWMEYKKAKCEFYNKILGLKEE